MDWTSSTERARRRPPIPVKIVIAGGFGVGKTTAVGAISEIDVLTTEAAMTEVAAEIDRTGHTPEKTQTTVALDFGRITIDAEIKLYLFGTPGQDRFNFLWEDLVDGALGAVVLVDTRRIEDSFPSVDFFEQRSMPFLLAVNAFDHAPRFALDEIREDIQRYAEAGLTELFLEGNFTLADAPIERALEVMTQLAPR